MRTGRPSGRLPLHPRPLPHEALSSWVTRLAAAYGLEPHEFLQSAFGVGPPSDGGELDAGGGPSDLVAAFAERTGVPAERMRSMTLAGYAPALTGAVEPSPGLFDDYVGSFGWFVPPTCHAVARPAASEPWAPWRANDLLGALPRCCPRCLVAEPCPYVRLHWRLAWMASCPLHGEVLVPLVPLPTLLNFLRDREPKYAAPDLLALDRITLGAVTEGTAVLPRGGGVVSGGVWLRALRSLLDEVVRPAAVYAGPARGGLSAAWMRAGRFFEARQDCARAPFE